MSENPVKKEYVISQKIGDDWCEIYKLKTKEELNEIIEKMKKCHMRFDRHLKICTYETYCKHQYEIRIFSVGKTITFGKSVGKTITFGKWERPLDWTVIDEDDDKMLLLCDKCVEKRIFDENKSDYVISEIRSWLNNKDSSCNHLQKDYTKIGFLNAFTKNEKKRIHICGGDYISLLSCEEYEKFKDKILNIETRWWLRSPGYYACNAPNVNISGDISSFGNHVNVTLGVRPALWLKKEKQSWDNGE